MSITRLGPMTPLVRRALTSEGTSYSDKISAPSGDDVRKIEERQSFIESPTSLERQLYSLARKYYGERGASCVAKFLADGHDVGEGLDDVRDAINKDSAREDHPIAMATLRSLIKTVLSASNCRCHFSRKISSELG